MNTRHLAAALGAARCPRNDAHRIRRTPLSRFCLFVLLLLSPTLARAEAPVLRLVTDSDAVSSVLTDLADGFRQTRKLDRDQIFEAVDWTRAKVPYHVYAYFRNELPKDPGPTYVIGEWRVGVLAGPNLQAPNLTTEQIRDFLRQVPAKGADPQPPVYFQSGLASAGLLETLQWNCMQVHEKMPWGMRHGYHLFRPDMHDVTDAKELTAQLQKSPTAIGFITVSPDPKAEKLQFLKIADTEDFIAPAVKPEFQADYPLSRRITLVLSKDAPPLAQDFCNFCISHEGAKIVAQRGLITPASADAYRTDVHKNEPQPANDVSRPATANATEEKNEPIK